MPTPLPEALYHAAARARRRWFDRHPEARRTLERPVISVGNLAFGGSGKTPIAAAIAAALCARGERPAILSRGYRRRAGADGVVLVSDGARILADVDRAGDEPLWLARSVPGAIVSVSPDRYLAGRLAELHCGATVHVLDDGFQHLTLARDVDLLVLSGRQRGGSAPPLREDPSAAMLCDAMLLPRGTGAEGLPPRPVFHWWRVLHDPVDLHEADGPAAIAFHRLGPVLLVAGIAAPERFFDDLRSIAIDIRDTMTFADHHPFAPADIDAIAARARGAGCAAVLTTEKDAMRLRRFRPLPCPVYAVPLTIAFEPSERFTDWIADHVAYARASRQSARRARRRAA